MSLLIPDLAGAWILEHMNITANEETVELKPPDVSGTLLLLPDGEMSTIVRGPAGIFGVESTAYAGTARIEGNRLINEVRIGTGLMPTGSTVEREIELLDAQLLLLAGQLMEHTFTVTWTKLH